MDYSKEEIAIKVFYRENPEEENIANDASGWVGAARLCIKNCNQ
ncbi:MAG: hypothetical protein ACYDIA_22585 [Candidatus Humimicrobiaceae bacterium]